jgi:hypothetical protein
MSAQHLGRKRRFWHRDYPYFLRSNRRLTGRISPVDHELAGADGEDNDATRHEDDHHCSQEESHEG